MTSALISTVHRYRDFTTGSIKNMKIGTKLIVIMAVVFSGFIAIGYTFYEMQGNQQKMQLLNDETSRFSQLVNGIEHNISDARFNEKQFLLTGNPQYIEKSKGRIADVNKLLDEVNTMELDEYTEETVEDLSVSISNLQNFLSELLVIKQKLGLDHDNGHRGELRKAVHDVEQILNVNKRLTLLNSMLMMRRHEKDYMARKLDKYIEKMAKEQKRFAGLLADTDLSKASVEAINKHMTSYYQKFQDLPTFYKVIESRISDVGSAELMTEMNLNELLKSRDSRVEEIRKTADENNQRLSQSFYLIGASVIFIVLVLMILVSRLITASMKQASKIANSIAEGNLDNEIKIKTNDEVGQFMRSLHIMQNNLHKSIEIERESARKSGRIKQALDNVNGSVMIANTEGKIIYMNTAFLTLMQSIETSIQTVLPDFDASKLMGADMKRFENLSTDKRCHLGDAKDTCTTDINVGDCSLRVVSNPVTSPDGQYMGSVLEWTDRSQEVAIEEEIQTIVNASLAGDLGQRIDLSNKSDFFEMLSSGINELVEVSDRVIHDTVIVLESIATGDLTKTIESEYAGTFGKLKCDVNKTIEKLTVVIDEINTRAISVLQGSHEIAQGNTNLSQRTEEQAASLEETSSSMAEMTTTVRQNAEYAREANQLSYGAREQAEKGGEVVGSAIASMSEITGSSKKIADIIGVIDEIAFQTNLLALNAAVEAARAGEQGRGFAVVASEVRNLAGRSATAAKEIKELIEDSVAKVDEGSKLVNESGQTLEQIRHSVKKVSDIVAEITAASEEQSTGIEQVNSAISQMDEMTQQNAALVEQAASASEIMGEEARGLSELVSFFKTTDNTEQRPAVERRSNERPWHEPTPPVKPASTVTTGKLVNSDIDDGEWEEF